MIKKKNPKAKHYVNNEEFYNALVVYFKECDVVEQEWEAKYGEQKQKLLDEGVKPKKIFDHLPEIMWPRVTEYLGKTMFDIARYSNDMPNFYGYSYKDEMIADGYEDCILRIRTFDTNQARIKGYQKTEVGKDRLLFTVGTRKEFHKQVKKFGMEIDLDKFEETIFEKFYVEYECDNGFFLKVDRNPFAYFTTACYYAAVRRIKKEKKQSTVKSEMVKNSGILAEMESATQSGDDSSYDNSYLSFLQENVDQDYKDKDPDAKKKKSIKRTTKAHQRKLREMEEREAEELERTTREDFTNKSEESSLLDDNPESIDEYYEGIDE